MSNLVILGFHSEIVGHEFRGLWVTLKNDSEIEADDAFVICLAEDGTLFLEPASALFDGGLVHGRDFGELRGMVFVDLPIETEEDLMMSLLRFKETSSQNGDAVKARTFSDDEGEIIEAIVATGLVS